VVIVGSLVLILVGVALLAYGLLEGSNAYLIGSVAASLLAAVVLIAGGRQAARPTAEDEPVGEPAAAPEPAERAVEEPAQEPAGAGGLGTDPADSNYDDYDGDEYDDVDLPFEPPPQELSPADAALVARMSDEVLIIDERPRYHWEGCERLRGHRVEPLPVSEAVALGFTPCGRCTPASELLARARPV
jgi:hypothetical protein